jgi:hypothetical protein
MRLRDGYAGWSGIDSPAEQTGLQRTFIDIRLKRRKHAISPTG